VCRPDIYLQVGKENRMTKKYKIYSEAFRRQVVSEYEAGSSIPSLKKKYGINGMNTVRTWILKYARQGLRHETVYIQTAEEASRVRELEKEVKELQQALGVVMLEKLKLESILEVLQDADGEEVKKNAPSLSNGSFEKHSKEQHTK
jgi:transposase-like protein